MKDADDAIGKGFKVSRLHPSRPYAKRIDACPRRRHSRNTADDAGRFLTTCALSPPRQAYDRRGLPAARPVPFPHDGSPIKRIKWLQREAELTAAIAEQRGNLSAKVKAIHEISRLIWLDQRLNQQATDDYGDSLYREHPDRIGERAAALFEEGEARREAALKGNTQEEKADSIAVRPLNREIALDEQAQSRSSGAHVEPPR